MLRIGRCRKTNYLAWLLRYWMLYVFTHPLLSVLLSLLYSQKTKKDGIALYHYREDTSDFVETVAEALTYLEQSHPLQYQLVKQEIRAIMGSEGRFRRSPCAYLYGERIAQIDRQMCYDFFRERQQRRLWVCAQLINMATMGRLVRLCFPLWGQCLVRIDRICIAQENRFIYAVHRATPLPDDLLKWYLVGRYKPVANQD